MKKEIMIEIKCDLGYPMIFVKGIEIDSKMKDEINKDMQKSLREELEDNPYNLLPFIIDNAIFAIDHGYEFMYNNDTTTQRIAALGKEYKVIMNQLQNGLLCIPGYKCNLKNNVGPIYYHGTLHGIGLLPLATRSIYQAACEFVRNEGNKFGNSRSKYVVTVDVADEPSEETPEQDEIKKDTIKLLVREQKDLPYGERYKFEMIIPDIKQYSKSIMDVITFGMARQFQCGNCNPVYETARAIWEDGALFLDLARGYHHLMIFEKIPYMWNMGTDILPPHLCENLEIIHTMGYNKLVELWEAQGKPEIFSIPGRGEPKFQEGDSVCVSREWLFHKNFDEMDILSWLKKAVIDGADYHFTVQKVEWEHGEFRYLLDRQLCDKWMPEGVLEKY